jgi:hypothetical protein
MKLLRGQKPPAVPRQNAMRGVAATAMATEEIFSNAGYRNILQITLMWVPPLCIDMYEGRTQVASTHSTAEHTERRTLGGLVAYLLTVPALVAVMAAPALALGATLGVVGLLLGRRVADRLRRQQGGRGLSPSETNSGQPA